MAEMTVSLPIPDELGPKMQALLPMQQRFVWAMMHIGDRTKAVMAAGYKASRAHQTASELMQNTRVLDALHEVGWRKFSGMATKAIIALEKIVDDPDHPKHNWAIDAVLNRTGYATQTEHKVKVEHSINELQVKAVAARMAEQLGVDQTKLLGTNDIIEVEAVEVKDAE
jgi:phage terminase small subunit